VDEERFQKANNVNAVESALLNHLALMVAKLSFQDVASGFEAGKDQTDASPASNISSRFSEPVDVFG
jgi:hypothetical protein